ncbi:NlpC-P60 family protein [Stenotrophomonas sp. ZAC14D2_NAIMI4_7]|uniref:C40 family peptidase n=1 Tax=Stenotrophomonas sp. ZAC14D2_NAIMI4_7 TaxID=2072405 RepID=UPI000D53FAB5|nr:SH3 domain-containing protein [Stenotrophomonas sp. ZAC14D2_NAIMI4_7]AWH19511.1 NlpC-P60 family protein [Stenotrophomonas sp. ZAC14D2_NAIMI4_7]
MILASRKPRRVTWRRWSLALCLLATPVLAQAAPGPDPGAPLPYVIGLHEAYLTPDYWAARLDNADAPILDRAQIQAQNARMRAKDAHIQDIAALPAQLSAQQVRAGITALSQWPTRALYNDAGQDIAPAQRSAIEANLGLQGVPAQVSPAYGLVVKRAALRTFPTRQRVFSSRGDTDIDRFQESALFPGDKVAVVHRSADGRWLFVHSERYSAWIEAEAVATGEKASVLGYATQGPYRIVTGAVAHTAYTPEEPRVSRLQLDMGVRLPVLADWPAATAVNGQQAHAAWVVQLPVREADGSLKLVPALLPRSQDTAADYLPLTPRLLLQQAFKFLGERYGWGHDYDTRDCSGFVSEIYRSFGVLLPRNTSAQAVSPALDRLPFTDKDSKAVRDRAVANLQVGDLVYIPGHVMMAIGHVDGRTWVIHDTAGGSWFGADGQRVQAHLNGVSVTPLEPMMASDTVRYIDRITNIQRLRTKTPE